MSQITPSHNDENVPTNKEHIKILVYSVKCVFMMCYFLKIGLAIEACMLSAHLMIDGIFEYELRIRNSSYHQQFQIGNTNCHFDARSWNNDMPCIPLAPILILICSLYACQVL